MNILYFASVDFYAKPNPSFHLMHAMITDILENGHCVYFIGCEQDGIDAHIPPEFASHENFFHRLIPVPNTKKSNFVKRYLDGITYARRATKHIKQFVKDCDLIFVQSSPTVLYNLAAAKKYAAGKPILYNVQDMFPGSSIASGVMPNKLMQSFFFKLQKCAYDKADVIVAISDDMKDKLIEQGVDEEKIRVIVNWFDDKTVTEIPWEDNRFVKAFGMNKQRFYVQYAGTMGYVFDYSMILKVAETLKEYKDIVFQMIGEGSQKSDFAAAAKERGLDNIVFLPLQPQNMVSDVYSACSVCIIPLKHGVIGNSVPSKAGLLMACKRAIVTSTDADSKYNRMINENHIGIAVGDDDPCGMANAILYYYQNRQECQKAGQNGHVFGHELFSRRANMKRYLALFEVLAQKGS